MFKSYGIIREAAQRISESIEATVESLKEGRVEQEPAFTDRMLGRMEETMEGFRCKGISWSAKTLTSLGPGSQESAYGADFLGVLNVAIPGYNVAKGFLAQAKLIEENGNISQKEYERMQGQCKKMLSLSQSSFVFLYSKSGVYIVPAISILGSEKINPHLLYKRNASRFYMDHFSSFIGDRAINIPHIKALKYLLQEFNARAGIFFKVGKDQDDKNVVGNKTETFGNNLDHELRKAPLKRKIDLREGVSERIEQKKSAPSIQKWGKIQKSKKKLKQLNYVKIRS